MTGMAATKIGLKHRGILQAGRAADVTVFDPATVSDAATFPDPHRYPVGIPYVIVNGLVVVDGAQYHALPAGRVLTPA
jgi:N-acyl-D-aspartate/D-glutamate deacylase